MKRAIKILLIISLSLFVLFLTLLCTYYTVTAGTKLDENKLVNYKQSIEIFDNAENKVESASLTVKRESVYLENLNHDTINAFIASEDRNFYKHNGLNHKRMLKALYKNIISFSFKEGASTISQQLVKNTHLSNDKKISRKLKEIRLTKQLEKKYTKDQILEMYLNTIYFGHNCYGLQSAAKFYFNKEAEQLTLAESATLAGLLTSPNNYSPYKNPDKCLARRNIVLKNMLDCNFIDNTRYNDSISKPVKAQKPTDSGRFGDYLSAVFDELEELFTDFYGNLSQCKIYTYLNQNMQKFIENIQFDHDNSVIITNKNHGIEVYKSSINGAKRQPGSTVKPLFVYAPAIQEKLIHTFTKIEDEKIDYNGYSPENYDKKYHGAVTVKQCLSDSYNIPAVKTLNALSLKKAELYVNRLGIELEDEEKNLALALGGMKHGLTLKEICDAYSTFSNGGNYYKSHFIKQITDSNGKIIYSNPLENNNVYSTGTSALINDMLIETSKSGTAKKLKYFNFDIASKTGTCGNEQGNTDAYTISYSSDATFGVWLGDKNYNKLNVTGGRDCCNIMKDIIGEYYKTYTPESLDTQSDTTTIEIDRQEYNKNGSIILADKIAPVSCKLKVKCLSQNIPTQISSRFSVPAIQKPTISVDNNKVNIILCQAEYYSYLIKRNNIVVYDDKYIDIFVDEPEDGCYIYTVTPYYDDGKEKHFGNAITLERVIVGDKSNTEKPPNIIFKDWFNQ